MIHKPDPPDLVDALGMPLRSDMLSTSTFSNVDFFEEPSIKRVLECVARINREHFQRQARDWFLWKRAVMGWTAANPRGPHPVRWV